MQIKSAVVLKLEGGLGNQLFELAAGYFLASKLNTELHLDQYSIPLTTVHGEKCVGFDQFEILPVGVGTNILVTSALPSRLAIAIAKRSAFAKKVFIKLRMFRSNPDNLELFLEDNSSLSVENFLRISKPVKLHGNFQSWNIVEKAAEYGFPRVFQLQKIPKWITDLRDEVDFGSSVVLHFRVGDDTRLNSNFRQPEISYYLSALNLLLSRQDFHEIYIY